MLSAAVLSTALIGACSAEGPRDAEMAEAAPPAGGAARQPSPTSPPDDAADTDDVAVCTAFGDVLTIMDNADVGLAEGRMEAQERDGWHRLASRVLDRLPSGGDSAVQAAVRQLQAAPPAIPSGAFAESTGGHSPEWSTGMSDLHAACDELGAPLTVTMFTGG